MAHDDDVLMTDDNDITNDAFDDMTTPSRDGDLDTPLTREKEELDEEEFSEPQGLRNSDPGVVDEATIDALGWQEGAGSRVDEDDLDETYGMHVDGALDDDDTISLDTLEEDDEDSNDDPYAGVTDM